MPKMPLPPAESIQLDSLAEVARGGMGSVELARAVDGRLAGQILAVKRLHANIAEDPEFVSMFLDEAWMTAALKHPNVAQVVAWGNDDKGMFLAIELVQGVSLSRLIKEAQQNQEAFAERTVAFICSQLCAGLVAAHTLVAPDGSPLGLVHRDLTPANVLISFDGVVKIIDFGIAKAEERISHTRTGQLKGKPAYMAPEQQRGGAVDARADLFAFGVVMFEMLAGRRPWTSKGAFDVMMEISNDPHPDLGDLRKGLNPEFVAMAHKCLEKKPEDRFHTAAEIKARLDGWLAAKGFSSDDQHSLAQFVLRNSQPQVLWWKEALRGEHSKKKAPTFKELEEKIDEERERKAKAAKKAATPPPRPAAGVPQAGTQPMQAYRPASNAAPDSGGAPLSGPISSARPAMGAVPANPQQPSGGNIRASMMGVAPSSLAGPGQGGQSPHGSGQYSAAAPSSLGSPGQGGQSPHGSGQYSAVTPVSVRKPISNAGTEFLAMSPFAGGDPATQHHGSQSPSPPHGPSSPPHGPFSPPYPPPGTDSGTLPMTPGLALASMTQPLPPGAIALVGAPLDAARTTGMNLAPQVPSAPRRGSRVGLVILLVVVVLAGAGAGLWFFGDSIGLHLDGGREQERPRPAPAKGK